MYKSRYSVLISLDDLARAKSAYKKGNYAMNYFDPLHLKVVEQYLSHLSNEPHNTQEILEGALVRKIIKEDSYLQRLHNPEELIPKSFDELCDFIGSICNEGGYYEFIW